MKHPPISIVAILGGRSHDDTTNVMTWNLREDNRRFEELTQGSPVIMGRKTLEMIGKPLPNRTNIVITRDTSYEAFGAEVVHSLEEAIEKAKEENPFEIFVIGGEEIFKQVLPITDRLYLTLVDEDNCGHTHFPDNYKDHFPNIVSQIDRVNNGMNYSYVILERA